VKDILHRKDRLIITTIELIDELGLQRLSTREIANREGVSEATLFRHYKNKNDLLIAVVDFYSKFDEDIFLTTRLKKLGPKESIYFLVKSTVEYYENYPAITAITQLMDVLKYEPDLTEKINEIINYRFRVIKELIDEAIDMGEIKPEINSEYLSDMIIGTIRELCLRWRIHRDFSLKERAEASIQMLLESFRI
jgi:AcrR family transcriptional regulator